MKKLIALTLALIMALSMSVVAFASNVIVLDIDEEDEEDLTEVKTLDISDEDEALYIALAGGDYYFIVEDAEEYDDLTVSSTGSVAASLVEYDPTVYESIPEYSDLYYTIVEYHSSKIKYYYDGTDFVTDEDDAKHYTDYSVVQDLADDFNDDRTSSSYKYVVVASKEVYLIKATVEDNFTAAYKTGTVTVTGELDDEDYKYTFDIISDVVIFAYEDVKDAAEYEIVLDDDYQGYSDYLTSKYGYTSADLEEAAVYGFPTVVSTTEFRAIAGSDITFDYGQAYITIEDVVSGQKGVNFMAYFDGYDEDDETITFGFPCKTVIQSDFSVNIDLDKTWFDVRELFKAKLEEDDVITYYILKDGKLFDTVVVDYGNQTVTCGDETEDVDVTEDDVTFTIEGKAGQTLGEYTIQLTAPSSSETDSSEENPNTGAENIIGVVCALSVMAFFSAAAVSLRK